MKRITTIGSVFILLHYKGLWILDVYFGTMNLDGKEACMTEVFSIDKNRKNHKRNYLPYKLIGNMAYIMQPYHPIKMGLVTIKGASQAIMH